MPLTWVSVADTAIKIGLGAAIAGFFAVVSLIVGHRQRLVQSREGRLWDALEGISGELESSLSRVFLKGLDDAKYAEDQLGDGYDEEEWWERVTRYEADMDDAIATLSVLEGRLRLYGCHSSADALTQISEALLGLPRKISPMTAVEPDAGRGPFLDVALRAAFAEIGAKKEAFYRELSKEGRRVVR